MSKLSSMALIGLGLAKNVVADSVKSMLSSSSTGMNPEPARGGNLNHTYMALGISLATVAGLGLLLFCRLKKKQKEIRELEMSEQFLREDQKALGF